MDWPWFESQRNNELFNGEMASFHSTYSFNEALVFITMAVANSGAAAAPTR